MKSIELTENHKSKLLEMCKVLFPEPEFYFWWEYEMYGRGLKQNFNDVLCVSETLNPPINVGTEEKPYFRTKNYFNIHWFEFCMTHLFEKIMVIPYYYESINDYIQMNGYFIYGHPVDYLYKEFKKLK